MMYIKEIHINGFGKYCNYSITNLSPGLNIILGANEAGKTTIHSFIKSVLYGFADKRSKANTYPPFNGGRHGGRLVLIDDGKRYIIERFSDSEVNLIMPNGSNGNMDQLSSLLGDTDHYVFSNIYAVGLNEMQDINSFDSDKVRTRLFSAGTGLGTKSLTELTNHIDKQSGLLYKPNGKNPEINKLIQKIEQIDTQLNSFEDDISNYDRLNSELNSLNLQIVETRTRSKQNQEEVEVLERIKNTYEDLEELKNLRNVVIQKIKKFNSYKKNQKIKLSFYDYSLLVMSFFLIISAIGLMMSTKIWKFPIVMILAAIIFEIPLIYKHVIKRKRQLNDIENDLRIKLNTINNNIYDTEKTCPDFPPGATKENKSILSVEILDNTINERKQGLLSNEAKTAQLLESKGNIKAKIDILLKDNEKNDLLSTKEVLIERINSLAEKYLELNLAKSMLQNSIEIYEDLKQPTLLKEAQKFFAYTTDGNYRNIHYTKDTKSFYVEDKNGQTKDILELSRGTAQQLYLALRLGYIKDLSINNKELPLIMDDIFVNFDDKRIKAAIGSIQDILETNQVFYMTCHRHIHSYITDTIPNSNTLIIV